jgi:hypothetical protein
MPKRIQAETHISMNIKGIYDGVRMVLVLRQGGTTLVPLTALTDAELA